MSVLTHRSGLKPLTRQSSAELRKAADVFSPGGAMDRRVGRGQPRVRPHAATGWFSTVCVARGERTSVSAYRCAEPPSPQSLSSFHRTPPTVPTAAVATRSVRGECAPPLFVHVAVALGPFRSWSTRVAKNNLRGPENQERRLFLAATKQLLDTKRRHRTARLSTA